MAKKFSIKKFAAGVLALLMVVTALPVSGISSTTSKAADADTAEVYRSYNPNNGEHLLTVSKSEHDFVVGLGYNDEGKRFLVPTSSKTPIYRAYDPNSGEHLLVPEEEAKWLAETQGWDNEGIKMYADDDKSAGVYRVYNPNATNAGRHNYSNKEEADWLVAQGWVYDNDGEPVFYSCALLGGDVKAVYIDNITPKVGDFLTAAAVSDDEGTLATNVKSYQWYRTKGTADTTTGITGETAATYEVQTIDIGYFLYVTATDDKGNVIESKTTGRVSGQEVSSVSIEGLTTKSSQTVKTNDLALVGDTLEAVTDPEGAANLVTYQWYRNGAKISGATEKTYTLQDADWKAEISVIVKAIDSEAVTFETAGTSDRGKVDNKIAKNINTTTAKLSATNIVQGNKISVTVKDGETKLNPGTSYTGTESYKVTWYQDSEDGKKLTAEATDTTGATYEVQAEDIGHAIVAKIEALSPTDTGYVGSYTISTDESAGTITGQILNLTGEGQNYGVGSVLTATLYKDATDKTKGIKSKATVTYAFYRDGILVQDGTKDTYTLTTDDVVETPKVHKYTVIATGTGAYSGSLSNVSTDPISATGISVNENLTLEGFTLWKGTTQLFDDALASAQVEASVAAGDTLDIKAVSEAIGDELHGYWYETAASDTSSAPTAADWTLVAADTLSYTIPSDWNTTKVLKVMAFYKGDDDDNIVPGASCSTLYTTAGTAGFGADMTITTGAAVTTKYTSGTETPATNYAGHWFAPTYASAGSVDGGDDIEEYSYAVGVSKAVTSATVTYDNGVSKSNKKYKTYSAPEVGARATVEIKPLGAAVFYQWVTIEDGVPVPIANENSNTYTITEAVQGKILACAVSGYNAGTGAYKTTTGSTGYNGVQVLSDNPAVVGTSTRTFEEIKVVDNTVTPTKSDWSSISSATEIDTTKTYTAYVLDSNGEVKSTPALNSDGSYDITVIWDGESSDTYLNNVDGYTILGTSAIDAGLVSVTIIPDGVNYTGNPISYQFKTEVSSETAETTTGKFLFKATGSTVNTSATGTTVATAGTDKVYISKAATKIMVTISDITDGAAVASYQWYGKDSSTNTAVAVDSGATGTGLTRTLTIANASSDLVDEDAVGVQYYVVVTDSLGNKYTSPVVELAEPIIATAAFGSGGSGSITVTAGTKTAVSANKLILTDQFGNNFSEGDASAKLAALPATTIKKSGEDTDGTGEAAAIGDVTISINSTSGMATATGTESDKTGVTGTAKYVFTIGDKDLTVEVTGDGTNVYKSGTMTLADH